MNKNWLYRVLAIALVAMLALPVFAMAEEAVIETAAFELGADGAAEEGEIVEKTQDVTVEGGFVELDLYPADRYYELTDDLDMVDDDWQLTPGDCNFKITFVNDSELASAKFTSNTTKVASVSSKGVVTLKKPGSFKITVRLKNKNKMKFNRYLTGKFKNSQAVKRVRLYEQVNDEEKKEWKSTKNVVRFFTYTLFGLAQYEDDGDYQEVDKRRVVLTSSSDSILKIKELNEQPTPNDMERAYFTAEAKKTGTVNITLTPKADKSKKTKIKVKVCKNAKTVNDKDDLKKILKKAKDDEKIYMGIKSVEMTDVSKTGGEPTSVKYKVTFYVANGTKNTWRKLTEKATVTVTPYKQINHFEAPEESEEGAIFEYEFGKSLPKAWKKEAVTTWTATITDKDLLTVQDLSDFDLYKCEVAGGGVAIDSDVLVWKNVD